MASLSVGRFIEADVTGHWNSELACGNQEITVANSRTDDHIRSIMPIPGQRLEPLAPSGQIQREEAAILFIFAGFGYNWASKPTKSATSGNAGGIKDPSPRGRVRVYCNL